LAAGFFIFQAVTCKNLLPASSFRHPVSVIAPYVLKTRGYPQKPFQIVKKSYLVNEKSEIFPYLCPPLI
jgi:hypothetical protein